MPENKRESVTLARDTLIQGEWHRKGDSVEVYPFQKRHLVEAGYAEGSIPEDIVSPGEEEQGALNVLKRPEDRDDKEIWSADLQHREGWGFGDPPKQSSQSSKDKSSK